MLQPRTFLKLLAPLGLSACALPAPTPATSPLRPPSSDDRFEQEAPDAEAARAGAAEATSGADTFAVAPVAAGSPTLRLEFEPDCAGFLGTPIPIALHVFNDGPGTARELIVLTALPPELSGPGYRGILELVRSELHPGESTSLRAPLMAESAGLFEVDALASALESPLVGPVRGQVLVRELEAAPPESEDEVAWFADPVPVRAPATEAAAAANPIRLRVTAPGDVVFVGDRTDYRVRVTNTGAAARHGLALNVSLGDGLDLVSISGATAAAYDGDELRATPLGSLAPGQTVEWRLIARSYEPGAGRMVLRVTCDDGSVREEAVTTSFRAWSR